MSLRLIRAWLPTAVMCIAIFLFSQDAQSGQHSAAVLAALLKLFHLYSPHAVRVWDEPFRKLAHVIVYALLGTAAYRGFAVGRRNFSGAAALRAVIFSAAYACTDEYHQSFIPGRGPSPRDVMLDSAAALLAMGLLWLLLRARPQAAPPLPATRRANWTSH